MVAVGDDGCFVDFDGEEAMGGDCCRLGDGSTFGCLAGTVGEGVCFVDLEADGDVCDALELDEGALPGPADEVGGVFT